VLNHINRNTGFTLVEILISLLLGALLLAMVISLYVTNVSAGNKAMKLSRLRTDAQALMGVMEEDIRRASYGGNDFLVGLGRQKVIDSINSETEKCVIYSYNYDDAISADSRHIMGFRYSSLNKSIQFGRRVDPRATHCFQSGAWVNLTDPSFIKVHRLEFTESSITDSFTTKRSLNINILIALASDSRYNHQLQTMIQVRNVEH